jgi:hypothetical protein
LVSLAINYSPTERLSGVHIIDRRTDGQVASGNPGFGFLYASRQVLFTPMARARECTFEMASWIVPAAASRQGFTFRVDRLRPELDRVGRAARNAGR